jgi:hypothetical protein
MHLSLYLYSAFPTSPAITTYFNIFEPNGTLGDVIAITFSPDPTLFINFQSAGLAPLIAGTNGPASVATSLIETGQIQTATTITTTTGAAVDIQFLSDSPSTPTPEPSSILLVGTGAIALLGAACRKLLT